MINCLVLISKFSILLCNKNKKINDIILGLYVYIIWLQTERNISIKLFFGLFTIIALRIANNGFVCSYSFKVIISIE